LKETRVALIASGLLNLLPLHAARWQVGRETFYLLEELDLVYAPSAWVLQRCWARKRGDGIPVLAVATSGEGAPLVFSEWEAQRLKELLEQAKGPDTCLQLFGPAANAGALLDALPRHAVSHLSCHGNWDSSNPLESALMLADQKLTLARLLENLRLDKTSLVVLSACESGTAYTFGKSGEEYLGLPAGFIFAGARSVIGTLWSVLDPPTALLMVKLYQNLLAGAGVSDALRAAQIWLKDLDKETAISTLKRVVDAVADSKRHKALLAGIDEWMSGLELKPFSHPYFWAAFQTLGSSEPVF
jgi:CHAT domain-containing protein